MTRGGFTFSTVEVIVSILEGCNSHITDILLLAHEMNGAKAIRQLDSQVVSNLQGVGM